MSRFQLLAVGICITLNMLDGFDVLVMSFTAPRVSSEWQLSGSQLGVLLSAGLFGMAAGSLFVSPLGDRFGRRPVILACLGGIALGMLLSALAPGPVALAVLRAVTGVGIGGMLASLNVITSEYASAKWRSTAVSLQATGYPIGATIGGSIAALLIAVYGWRAAFLFGAFSSALMIPIVLRGLPESLDFLIAKRPGDALPRLNDLMRRMNRPELERLPDAPRGAQGSDGSALQSLRAALRIPATLWICASFFLAMFSFYFVLSWTPKLLVQAGLSAQQGITGGVLLNLGGIIGGTLFGYAAARVDLKRLEYGCISLAAVSMVLFGLLGSTLGAAFLIALGMGTFLFGVMVGLYALAPLLYPPAIRTTGMGLSIGIGRFGAILAPISAGFLVDAGWQTGHLYYVFALPILGALLSIRALRPAAIP